MIKLKAPEGCTEVNNGPDTFPVDSEGFVTVPNAIAEHLHVHGFKAVGAVVVEPKSKGDDVPPAGELIAAQSPTAPPATPPVPAPAPVAPVVPAVQKAPWE